MTKQELIDLINHAEDNLPGQVEERTMQLRIGKQTVAPVEVVVEGQQIVIVGDNH